MSNLKQPSVGLLRQALVIAERIQQLEEQLAAILKQDARATASTKVSFEGRGPGKIRTKPKFSAAARASIAAAQRERWAKYNKEKGKSTVVVAKKEKKRKKPKFSAEAREKIAAAQRKRWAKARKSKQA